MQLGKDLKKVLKEIEDEKGLPQDVIISSLEAAMVSAYKKFKGGNQNAEVYIDVDSGEFTLYEVRRAVTEIENEDTDMLISEAKESGFGDDIEEGDTIKIEVMPENFGRIAAQTARQVIIQRLKDAERQVIYEEFADKIGNIITGTIFKVEGDQVLVRLNDRTEAIMPKEERIAGEAYIPDTNMKFYLLDVRQMPRGPRIILSRTHPELLKRLLELEIPEIQDGVVEIRRIVREAGTRAKIAVSSLDVNVEPLGACVGKQGNRIKSISTELNDERIDIIVWSNDPLAYIRNALSPAKVIKVEPLLDQDKSVIAYVRPDQLSLAIGRAGQNVRLAARLTGWKIDIKVKEEEKLPTMKDLFVDITDIMEDGKSKG
jgi:N utilization substance protein A